MTELTPNVMVRPGQVVLTVCGTRAHIFVAAQYTPLKQRDPGRASDLSQSVPELELSIRAVPLLFLGAGPVFTCPLALVSSRLS